MIKANLHQKRKFPVKKQQFQRKGNNSVNKQHYLTQGVKLSIAWTSGPGWEECCRSQLSFLYYEMVEHNQLCQI